MSLYFDLEAKGQLEERHIAPDVSRLEIYVSAFHELSSCRNNGMSRGQIPFTVIVEYFTIFNVGDFDEFLYLIRVMDREYLILERDSQKAEAKSAQAKNKAKK